jgi:hypothetical protein
MTGLPIQRCWTIAESNKVFAKHTCSPGSAVVGALELGSRVDNVAGGKDVDSGNSVLAVNTTTIQILIT